MTTPDTASTYSSSTEYSYVKEPETTTTAAATAATSATDKPKKSSKGGRRTKIKQRIRGAISDLGNPPTSRYDAENGLETPRHVDLGMVRASAVSRT